MELPSGAVFSAQFLERAGIAAQKSGIGSGSCGPQLDPKYRLNGTHYSFGFHIKPEEL